MERKNLPKSKSRMARMSMARKSEVKAIHFSDVPQTPERPTPSVSYTGSIANATPSQMLNHAHDITEARDAISSHKLYISNLPDDATFGDIQKLFPTAVSVVMDNRSTKVKSAILEFDNWKTCEGILHDNKRTKLNGKVLIVSPKASA